MFYIIVNQSLDEKQELNHETLWQTDTVLACHNYMFVSDQQFKTHTHVRTHKQTNKTTSFVTVLDHAPTTGEVTGVKV